MSLITFLSAALRFLQGLTFFFLAMILQEKGLDGLHIGVLLSTYTLTPILLSLPAGVMNDRFTSRGLLAAALAGSAAFYLVLVKTAAFGALWPAFFLGGASMNLATISLQSIALKTVGVKGRSTKLGLFQGGTFIGYGVGLVTGGLVMQLKSPEFLLSCAALAFLALVAFSSRLKETARVHLDLFEYLSAFRERGVLILCVSYGLFALHWGSEGASYGLFLRDWFHLSRFQCGLFMGLPIVGLGLAAVFTGTSLDRRGGSLRGLTIAAFLFSGLGQALMAVPNIYLSFALRLVHEVGDGMAGTLLLTEMARRFSIDRIGGQSSLVTLCTVLAQSIGLFVFSGTGQLWGHHWSLIMGGVTAVAPIALLICAGKRGAAGCDAAASA